MAVRVDKHVLRLHIPIRNALMLMEEFEDEYHFGDIEAGSVLVKMCRSPEIGKDFATRAIVQLARVSTLVMMPERCLRTSMYRQSLSEKLVIIVVMNG